MRATRLAQRFDYASRLGLLNSWSRLTAREGAEFELRVPGTAAHITLRKTTADLATFDQIFLHRQYDDEALGQPAPRVVVDAGAHIGLASVFFALHFPSATIVAVEPDIANFGILKRNTHAFKNVVPINAAIWDRTTRLDVVNPGAASWAFHFKTSVEGKIPAVGLEDVSKKYGPIDVLKMDIEGGELPVFQASDLGWFQNVRLMMIELHDRIVPGCTRAVYHAAMLRPFERRLRGDVDVFDFSARPRVEP